MGSEKKITSIDKNISQRELDQLVKTAMERIFTDGRPSRPTGMGGTGGSSGTSGGYGTSGSSGRIETSRYGSHHKEMVNKITMEAHGARKFPLFILLSAIPVLILIAILVGLTAVFTDRKPSVEQPTPTAIEEKSTQEKPDALKKL